MVKYAPMGDPMELRIHSYELTLRLADAEKIEITDGEEPEVTDNEEAAFTDGESEEAGIEVFAGDDEAAPTLTGIEVLNSEISLYEERQSYENYIIEDILTLKYSDGTESKPGKVYLGDTLVRDKDWNIVKGITAKLVYADSDKAEAPVVWSEKNNAQYLQPGSYKYIFTWTPEDETQKPVSVETRINCFCRCFWAASETERRKTESRIQR